MLRKIISFFISFCFIFEQAGFAQVAGQLDISARMSSLYSTLVFEKYRPLHLRYLSYDQLNNDFKLLLDKGSAKETNPQVLEKTTGELFKYFFIGLALPNDEFWVNLRPDSPDEMIDADLAKTDIGKVMLECDLQLKKDAAKYTSPETFEGREYWDKLYKRAEELYGSENITIPTLTRPWIVPDEIVVRETQGSAYIYKATLKVMLEQDYLKGNAAYSFPDEKSRLLNEYSSQLIRETIIPKLTREVNSSKRYAGLRQVYYSLILAQWFKDKYKNTRTENQYIRRIDTKDLTSLTSQAKWNKDAYFKAYQKSFKDGEYNIKENRQSAYGQTIRAYFSGGVQFTGEQIAACITAGLIHARGRIPAELEKYRQVQAVVANDGGVIIENTFAAGQGNAPAQKDGGNISDIRTWKDTLEFFSREKVRVVYAGNEKIFDYQEYKNIPVFAMPVLMPGQIEDYAKREGEVIARLPVQMSRESLGRPTTREYRIVSDRKNNIFAVVEIDSNAPQKRPDLTPGDMGIIKSLWDIEKARSDGGSLIGELRDEYPLFDKLVRARDENAHSGSLDLYYSLASDPGLRLKNRLLLIMEKELGMLRTHANLIVDTRTQTGILFVGDKEVGKSTISRILVENFSGRFLLAAEDSVLLVETPQGVFAGLQGAKPVFSVARGEDGMPQKKKLATERGFVRVGKVIDLKLQDIPRHKVSGLDPEQGRQAIKDWERIEQEERDRNRVESFVLADPLVRGLQAAGVTEVDVPVSGDRDYAGIAREISELKEGGRFDGGIKVDQVVNRYPFIIVNPSGGLNTRDVKWLARLLPFELKNERNDILRRVIFIQTGEESGVTFSGLIKDTVLLQDLVKLAVSVNGAVMPDIKRVLDLDASYVLNNNVILVRARDDPGRMKDKLLIMAGEEPLGFFDVAPELTRGINDALASKTGLNDRRPDKPGFDPDKFMKNAVRFWKNKNRSLVLSDFGEGKTGGMDGGTESVRTLDALWKDFPGRFKKTPGAQPEDKFGPRHIERFKEFVMDRTYRNSQERDNRSKFTDEVKSLAKRGRANVEMTHIQNMLNMLFLSATPEKNEMIETLLKRIYNFDYTNGGITMKMLEEEALRRREQEKQPGPGTRGPERPIIARKILDLWALDWLGVIKLAQSGTGELRVDGVDQELMQRFFPGIRFGEVIYDKQLGTFDRADKGTPENSKDRQKRFLAFLFKDLPRDFAFRDKYSGEFKDSHGKEQAILVNNLDYILKELLKNSYDGIAAYFDRDMGLEKPESFQAGKIRVSISRVQKYGVSALEIFVQDNGAGPFGAATARKAQAYKEGRNLYFGKEGLGEKVLLGDKNSGQEGMLAFLWGRAGIKEDAEQGPFFERLSGPNKIGAITRLWIPESALSGDGPGRNDGGERQASNRAPADIQVNKLMGLFWEKFLVSSEAYELFRDDPRVKGAAPDNWGKIISYDPRYGKSFKAFMKRLGGADLKRMIKFQDIATGLPGQVLGTLIRPVPYRVGALKYIYNYKRYDHRADAGVTDTMIQTELRIKGVELSNKYQILNLHALAWLGLINLEQGKGHELTVMLTEEKKVLLKDFYSPGVDLESPDGGTHAEKLMDILWARFAKDAYGEGSKAHLGFEPQNAVKFKEFVRAKYLTPEGKFEISNFRGGPASKNMIFGQGIDVNEARNVINQLFLLTDKPRREAILKYLYRFNYSGRRGKRPGRATWTIISKEIGMKGYKPVDLKVLAWLGLIDLNKDPELQVQGVKRKEMRDFFPEVDFADGGEETDAVEHPAGDKGGIDFRGLPIGNPPAGLPVPAAIGRLPAVNIADLDREWEQIEQMAQSEMVPSTQRIREFLGACCSKGELEKYSGEVLACIAGIMRMEEEGAKATEPDLKEILVLLESGKLDSGLFRDHFEKTVPPAAEPQA